MNTALLLSKVRPNVRLFTRVLNIPTAAAWTAFVLASSLGLSAPAHAATAKAKPKAAPATNATLQSCSWDRPGKNPYMGELPSAVDRYTDLPSDVRTKLKDRIAKQQYDDVVDIKRDTIVSGQGKFTYASQIRDMHFGDKGRVCATVTRTRWKASTTERGYVYCESGQCVMVPTVCRNVSRVTQNKAPAVAADKAAAPAPVAAAAPSGGGPTAAKATPDAPAAAPTLASAGLGPAFADVSQGPVFAFPSGPTGTSSIAIVAPPAGTPAGGGAGAPGGSTPGGTTPPGVDPGTTVPGGTVPGGTVPGGVVGGVNVVTPIPEPSTYALMLVGLLAVGFAARRRKLDR